jgi:hypothetical protein
MENDKIEIVRVKKLHKMTRREKASQKVATSPPSTAWIFISQNVSMKCF